jgi:hypothetical protein
VYTVTCPEYYAHPVFLLKVKKEIDRKIAPAYSRYQLQLRWSENYKSPASAGMIPSKDPNKKCSWEHLPQLGEHNKYYNK